MQSMKMENILPNIATGWDPKTIALNNAIEEINERIEDAKQQSFK